MKFGKIVVLFMTAIFLAGAVFVWSKEHREDFVSVTVKAPGGTEVIRCQDPGWGGYAAFLPGFGEVSWEETEHAISPFPSANVPAMFVDVRSGSMEHIHQEKGNSEAGSMRIYNADGTLNFSGSFDSLKGRGSSTWTQEKKPYNLELSGNSNLLGMGAAKKWVLLANAMDPSSLRNKLVLDFAGALGMAYTPESRWVNLYLNGQYAGLYLLCERIEVHPERASLAGGNYFLVSKEWEWRMDGENEPYVQLDSKAALRLRNTNMEAQAVQAVFQSAENAILAADGIDPVSGKHWRELIDVDSWALKYLIEEVFGNVDGGTLSQYFYYDGGKVFAGPVWDYDLTMGNTFAYPFPAPNMLYVDRPNVYATVWYPALLQQEEFSLRMKELYVTRFRPLLEMMVAGQIDLYTMEMGQAAYVNMARWMNGEPLEEIGRIKEYLMQRMAFLDSYWILGEEYATVLVWLADDSLLRYEVRPGETLPQLPDYSTMEGWDVDGWYDKATQQPFDLSQPILEDREIYLKHAWAEGA